jgi:hypothetical protein
MRYIDVETAWNFSIQEVSKLLATSKEQIVLPRKSELHEMVFQWAWRVVGRNARWGFQGLSQYEETVAACSHTQRGDVKEENNEAPAATKRGAVPIAFDQYATPTRGGFAGLQTLGGLHERQHETCGHQEF